MCKGLYVRSKA